MSQNPDSEPIMRRALQVSRPDERWSTLIRHARLVDRYLNSVSISHFRREPVFFRCLALSLCHKLKVYFSLSFLISMVRGYKVGAQHPMTIRIW